MKRIKLTRGKFAIVDDEDYKKMNQYNWYASHHGYACRKTPKKERDSGKGSVTFMHRLVLGYEGENDIDHINGDRLDNRKENLRICSRAENLQNQRKGKNRSSKYKGVAYQKRDKKWQAYIMYKGKNHYLGYYDTEEEAAAAYNKAALKKHRDYASINDV